MTDAAVFAEFSLPDYKIEIPVMAGFGSWKIKTITLKDTVM
jgi:hypothetical protein